MLIYFSTDWKSRHRKQIVGITGSNNWSDVTINNWCTLQWSLEVKTYLVLWKVFKGCSFWICIWLTSNLSKKLFFHCFRDLFCWQEIQSQQLDQYRYNVWYFGYIFKLNFHTLAYNNFFKRIMIRSNYIQVNRNSTTNTFLFVWF